MRRRWATSPRSTRPWEPTAPPSTACTPWRCRATIRSTRPPSPACSTTPGVPWRPSTGATSQRPGTTSSSHATRRPSPITRPIFGAAWRRREKQLSGPPPAPGSPSPVGTESATGWPASGVAPAGGPLWRWRQAESSAEEPVVEIHTTGPRGSSRRRHELRTEFDGGWRVRAGVIVLNRKDRPRWRAGRLTSSGESDHECPQRPRGV